MLRAAWQGAWAGGLAGTGGHPLCGAPRAWCAGARPGPFARRNGAAWKEVEGDASWALSPSSPGSRSSLWGSHHPRRLQEPFPAQLPEMPQLGWGLDEMPSSCHLFPPPAATSASISSGCVSQWRARDSVLARLGSRPSASRRAGRQAGTCFRHTMCPTQVHSKHITGAAQVRDDLRKHDTLGVR